MGEYIQAYYKIFRSLSAYVKEHFPTGLTWNNKDGLDAVEALKQIQAGAAPPKATGAGGGPAPPPPPPPLPKFDDDGPPPPPMPPSGGASQGGDMTHKNPSIRAS